ncbi:MAG TPA: CheR family methyltransferase, partial [Alphaproteobacteria bacterium]
MSEVPTFNIDFDAQARVAKPWSQFPMGHRVANVSDLIGIGTEGDIEGTTMFHRHEYEFERLINYLKTQDLPQDAKILIAPCSVGCEAFSFAMMAHAAGLFDRYPNLAIYGLDVKGEYIAAAETQHYPFRFVSSVPTKYLSYFAQTLFKTEDGERLFKISDKIAGRVTFLPAQDILDHAPADGKRYDASACFCLFEHLG